ncbi:hypothetical protein Avbf_12940 [Armadillidium vulgare]|nr:hypothetical protein Avbf_12940 [Armadillidium vulgare]
MKGISVVFRQ